uniref:Zinc finger PHD-type domain-containing protein n=1 Tax=Kwoniella dejecticola CBS 10117 TaxID=1296121 RepID=A0A1A6AFK9_9TREE|nr:uncharacterized protein I303_00679 [Kwoniella dejecticola CBS 10117]OBR88862.1 hypothetical protein I303_00679 [Kwoniella dejecticola CBS 10117]
MGPLKQAFRPPRPISKTASITESQAQSQKQQVASQQSFSQIQSTAPTQDQAIVTKDESLEIIKATLYANIGAVCYLRDLLPQSDFQDCFVANSAPPPGKSAKDMYYLTKKEAQECVDRAAAEKSLTKANLQNNDQDKRGDHRTAKGFQWRKIRKDGSAQARYLMDLIQQITSIIQGVEALVPLPKQRFVAIRLFLNESTPASYGNSNFEDASNESLELCTHHVDDAPQHASFLGIQTGHHGITSTACSVVDYLPQLLDNAAVEAGPERYAAIFSHKTALKDDVEKRTVVWDASLPVFDRKLYDPSAPDIYTACIDPRKAVAAEDVQGALRQPKGRRTESGDIVEITPSQVGTSGPRETRKPSCRNRGSRYIPEETLQMPQTQPQTLRTPLRGTASESLTIASHGKSIPNRLFESQTQSQSYAGNASQAYVDKMQEGNVESSPSSRISSSNGPRHQTSTYSSETASCALRETVQTKKRKRNEGQQDSRLQTPRKVEKIVEKAMQKGGFEPRSTGKPKVAIKGPPKPKKPRKPRNPREPKPQLATKKLTKGKSATSSTTKKKKTDNKDKEKGKKTSAKISEIIHCYCNSGEDTGVMILCDRCDVWFHSVCLGFIDSVSASQRTVLCITCEMKEDRHVRWSQKQIDAALKEMGDLAISRQVLQEVRRLGIVGTKDLADISKSLILQGFVDGGTLRETSQGGSTSRSKSPAWQWLKTPSAIKSFHKFFKYGGGIENEIFAIRRWHAKDSQTQDQTQSLIDIKSEMNRSSPPASHIADSQTQDDDAEGEDDLDATPSDGLSIFDSGRSYVPYTLPEIRSIRSIHPIDCSVTWTNEKEKDDVHKEMQDDE